MKLLCRCCLTHKTRLTGKFKASSDSSTAPSQNSCHPPLHRFTLSMRQVDHLIHDFFGNSDFKYTSTCESEYLRAIIGSIDRARMMSRNAAGTPRISHLLTIAFWARGAEEGQKPYHSPLYHGYQQILPASWNGAETTRSDGHFWSGNYIERAQNKSQ